MSTAMILTAPESTAPCTLFTVQPHAARANDDARGLVPDDNGRLAAPVAPDAMNITVADGAGAVFDHHLPHLGLVDLDLFDDERLTNS